MRNGSQPECISAYGVADLPGNTDEVVSSETYSSDFRGKFDSVHSGGYKVTTTLDYRLTEQARSMINDYITAGLADNCACNNAAIATIEPSTGQLVVYAENRDPQNVTDKRISGTIDQLNEINQLKQALRYRSIAQ